MNRRDLLKLLISTPIAATLDVEKLLWVKDKTIFIPSQRQVDFFYGGNAGGGKTVWLHPAQYEVYKELLDLVEKVKSR